MAILGLFMVAAALMINFTMQDGKGKEIVSLALLLLGLVGLMLTVNAIEDSKYKEGQVDCMDGNVKYELHIKQDSTYKYIRE